MIWWLPWRWNFWLQAGKLILPAITAVVLGGGIGIHILADKRAERRIIALNTENLSIQEDMAAYNSVITGLTGRVEACSAEKLRVAAQAGVMVKKAREAATASREDREQMAGQLDSARRKYREAINTNESLRVYSTTVVPVAVLDRLRSANGETGFLP